MHRLLLLAVTTYILSTNVALATENLIMNGGFENTSFGHYYAGSEFGGWRVGGENANVSVNVWWDPGNDKDGSQYLTMMKIYPYNGDISQVVNLRPGREYALQFYIFSSRDGIDNHGLSEVEVISYYPASTLQNSRIISNPIFEKTYIPPSGSWNGSGWQEVTATFSALANQERLFFRVGADTADWFHIDAISLVELPVPEPPTLPLVVLATLGLVSVGLRRRVTDHASADRIYAPGCGRFA